MRLLESLACVTLVVATASSGAAQQRTLHWRSIDVEARLDSAGRLHVRERQSIVFTGDWNGGERGFDVRPGQQFQFERLLRADPATGAMRVLARGNLSQVDHYDLMDGTTLRWRSRAPGDPPFDNTTLDYVLEYSFANILIRQNEGYVLDHDFAFANRAGDIEHFSVTLALDDTWKAPAGFTGSFEAGPLRPGQGFVVNVPLTYTGTGALPQAPEPSPTSQGGVVAPAAASVPEALALGVLLLAGTLFLALKLYRREDALGRFAPADAVVQFDDAWLSANVFNLRPEVVGALWDDSTGAAEVAGVVARLVAEGKLRSEVRGGGRGPFRKDVLYLKLLVSRDELNDYERALIDSLFLPDSDETDTLSVRARYRKSGFNPAEKIRKPLAQLVESLNLPRQGAPKPSARPTLILFLIAVVLLVFGKGARPWHETLAAQMSGPLVFLYIVAMIAANAWQKRVEGVRAGGLTFLIPVALLVGDILVTFTIARMNHGVAELAGLTALALAMGNSVFNRARSRESAERIAYRRKLATARRFFARELQRQSPRLRDEWFPYLIAFGLGPQMDRWFHAFGGAASGLSTGLGGSSSASRSSGGGQTWTGFGGGGGFAGGGASGSWSAAVSGMAAGVSAPSSSSSGGGGGGGGSSGGGSGGGW